MTRPIPVSGQRQRRSKSCTACRAIKTKCKGLSEEFLHLVDDPDALAEAYPAGPSTHPRCERCQKNNVECAFAPSRRKGRPRRLPAGQPPQGHAAYRSGSEDAHKHEHQQQQRDSDASSGVDDQAEGAPATVPSEKRRTASSSSKGRHPYHNTETGTRLPTPEHSQSTPSPPALSSLKAFQHSRETSSAGLSSSSRPVSSTSASASPASYADIGEQYSLPDQVGQTGLLTPPTPNLDSARLLLPLPSQPLFTHSPLSTNSGGSSSTSDNAAYWSGSPATTTTTTTTTATVDDEYLGHLDALAARFLDEAYEWVPFLPSSHDQLVSYLACSRPVLTEAIECLLDPKSGRPCPCVDWLEGPGTSAGRAGLAEPSLADLQAATVLSLLAFAQRERNRSVELLQFACRHLLSRGWRGEATRIDDPLFTRSGLEDAQMLMDLGWYCWGIEVQLGIITGQRASIMSPLVPPPAVLDRTTARHYSFHVAFLATDYAHLWSLDADAERCAYLRHVLSLVQAVHTVCVETLREAQLPPYPIQLNSTRDRALRQDLILGAMLALAGGILILSSASPLSPYVAPALPCSLDTTDRPAPNSRHLHAIARSAKGIVGLVEGFGTTYRAEDAADGTGTLVLRKISWPETIHHPFFGCCLVVAARGLLILTEDLHHEIQTATQPVWLVETMTDSARAATNAAQHELQRIGNQLDLCEGFLRVQATRWNASEMLANEVSLLRRTANFT